ncbi:olfactory receptor 14J1-like, partial [Melospiza georgiana]|uniref:olfactory receptor 14J1-like n=1 Tax=Melospiza georgiana TaxID=44398 RepID=UPI0025AD7C29
LLGSRACAHMSAAAWASAFLNALLHTANTFFLPLCHGNALGQFFCEIPQILKLFCSKSHFRKFGLIAVSACLGLGCFVFIVFSYVQIFRAVLRIPSEQARHKAFSTCLPHLAVVSLFLSTGTFAYLKPPSISSPSLDLALSVLYSVVPLVPSAAPKQSWFGVSPPELVFQNFVAREVSEMVLSLMNKDKMPRLVKVCMESFPYFQLAYPRDVYHMVPAGASAPVRIRFSPSKNKIDLSNIQLILTPSTF